MSRDTTAPDGGRASPAEHPVYQVRPPFRPTPPPEDAARAHRDVQSLADLMPSLSSPQRRTFHTGKHDGVEEEVSAHLVDPQGPTTLRLMALTAVIAGGQLVWTVQQGFGTIELISLSLSKELVALVWLAAPLSGLIGQPLVGALSDASRSPFRRRQYMAGAAVIVIVALMLVAFAREAGGLIVDGFGWGIEGSWDPGRAEAVRKASLAVAVPSFVLLGLSLNALQAASRALILDVVAKHGQAVVADAWQGRMTHGAHLVGFAIGAVDLAHAPLFAWLPARHFARLCVVAVSVLLIGLCITVVCTSEDEPLPWVEHKKPTAFGVFRSAFADVGSALADLPLPLRRLFWAQSFAWLGWFSYLFFATLWVSQRYLRQYPDTPDTSDLPTRAGSLAMLLYALMALLSGTVLPILEPLGTSDWMDHRSGAWRATFRRLTPRTLWTTSQILFFALMMSTLLVRTVAQASAVIGLVGICWAVSCWVPYALVMQMIHETQCDGDDDLARGADRFSYSATPPISTLAVRSPITDSHPDPASAQSARSRITAALTECAPLLPRRQTRPGAAVVLGIHNVAIVVPQCITSIVASVLFRLVHATHHSGRDLTSIFVFGGISSLLSAALTRAIPPTLHELDYRDLLCGDCTDGAVVTPE